ncbi:hypothetical protein THAOC_15613 [Thalassiosira oceanica]|uniref:Uncharacterized protein n=1 Tax=Thalassiosira oceanica TaxID=159749 RepID=K0SEI1_THAOC|nr:hypothetical protein THAOC_15613 [Thalassiosira oceanica]|eukprot:EJK63715.1 hypothetical protein THAOC_15613 [Thalassiosira oceanica]
MPSTGPQLLLGSAAGVTAAVGVALSRLMLLETGEVVLLLAQQRQDPTCPATGLDGADFLQLQQQCIPGETRILRLGEAIVSAASSPHLRSVPLVLLLVSTTVFAIGVILTSAEARQLLSWARAAQRSGGEMSEKAMSALGVSNCAELSAKVQETQIKLKAAVGTHTDAFVDGMDSLVLDDEIRKFVRCVADACLCIGGTAVLYSLPDELFRNTTHSAKSTRRRLIRAVDPSLEQVLFRPGGARDAVSFASAGMKHSVMRSDAPSVTAKGEDSVDTDVTAAETLEPEDDKEDAESPVPSSRVVIQHEGQCTSEECRETIGEVISGTIHDVVTSNMGGGKSQSAESEGTIAENSSRHSSQITHGVSNSSKKLEKLLNRTSIAASALFLCHLRLNPRTRRSWGSMCSILASFGLASTAVGAGAISVVLCSKEHSLVENPVLALAMAKLNDVIECSGDRMQESVRRALNKLWVEIRQNKSLQMTVALAVFFGMRRRRGWQHGQDLKRRP